MASGRLIVVHRDDSFYVNGDVGHVSHNFLIDTGAQIYLIPVKEKMAEFSTEKFNVQRGNRGTFYGDTAITYVIKPRTSDNTRIILHGYGNRTDFGVG
jgi:hypothetical protein